jgi:hypothetical protein
MNSISKKGIRKKLQESGKNRSNFCISYSWLVGDREALGQPSTIRRRRKLWKTSKRSWKNLLSFRRNQSSIASQWGVSHSIPLNNCPKSQSLLSRRA